MSLTTLSLWSTILAAKLIVAADAAPPAPKPTCTLTPTGPLRTLYTGNPGMQVVALRAAVPADCAKLGGSGATVILRPKDSGLGQQITAQYHYNGANNPDTLKFSGQSDIHLLEFHNVPETSDVVTEWQVEWIGQPDAPNTAVFLPTAKLDMRHTLATQFDDEVLQSVAETQGQVYGVDFVAVKFAVGGKPATEQAHSIVQFSGPKFTDNNIHWSLSQQSIVVDKAACKQRTVATPPPSWQASEVRKYFVDEDQTCELKSLSGVPIHAEHESELPIQETLGFAYEEGGKKLWMLFVPVKLAESAMRPRLTLPLAQALYVTCPRNRVGTWMLEGRDHDVMAIHNSNVAMQECRVVISHDEILGAIARRHGIPVAVMRGYKAEALADLNRRITSVEKQEADLKSAGVGITASDKRKSAKITRQIARNKRKLGASIDEIRTSCAFSEAERLRRGEPCLNITKEHRERLDNLLAAYGTQEIVITVSTGKNAADTREVREFVNVNAGGRTEIAVPFPDGEPDPDQPYALKIAASPRSPERAEATTETGVAETAKPPAVKARGTNSDDDFEMLLRPRGPFGFGGSRRSKGTRGIRMFLTVPLNVTAMRFPASGKDLQNSSQNTVAQMRNFDIGLLASIEPWDYGRRQNALPVPLRFSSGFLVNNWTRAPIGVSWLLGGSVNLPLIEGTNQLDTSLALGLYWEVDLRQTNPFKTGSHVLLTLGFNIFSLLGAESAKK